MHFLRIFFAIIFSIGVLFAQRAVALSPVETQALGATQAFLEATLVPQLRVSAIPLSQVLSLLTQTLPKDVNIVVVDPEHKDPSVSLYLENITLYKALTLLAECAGFRLYVEPSVAILRLAVRPQRYETQTFALSRAALIELTGLHAQLESSEETPPRVGRLEEEQSLESFFARAGIAFEEGTRLAYDGTQLYVTQSHEALVLIEALLKPFVLPKQVQIEIKFLEVSQNALEELGVNWFINSNGSYIQTADPRYVGNPKSPTHLRSLNQAACAPGNQARAGHINNASPSGTQTAILNEAPAMPDAITLGSQAFSSARFGALWKGLDIRAVVRALEQRSDTELLHAPNITVVSGKRAEIKVVRKLYYPESYGETHASCTPETYSGPRRARTSAASSIAVLAARPQKFVFEEVGVKVAVMPRVETDGSIHLELTPSVTNLKDWILYGASSFLVSGRTTIEVPSGFYQPLFESRTLRTEVRLGDGHTLLMGGLTREESVEVNDAVPFLGKIPILGALFRSQGQATRKMTLLIAATARIVPHGHVLPAVPQPSLDLLQPDITMSAPLTRIKKSKIFRRKEAKGPRGASSP